MGENLKIGFIPTRMYVFSLEDAFIYKNRIREKISGFEIDFVDIDDVADEGMLGSPDEVEGIVKKMLREEVDGLFFPHCNFGVEYLVAEVAKKINKPVMIWGPRDEDLPEGEHVRDTQCGMFATTKVMRRFNVPFTYIVNCRTEDAAFEKGYKMFSRVCAVVKAFNRMKILQIDTRPAPFWTMIYSEGDLLDRFGIKVFPVALSEIVGLSKSIAQNHSGDVAECVHTIKASYDVSCIDGDALNKIAALKIAVQNLTTAEKCSAVAFQCWNALQDILGVMPCVSNGLLTQDFIPTTCETDVMGAISAVMLQEAGLRQSPTFFADITMRHPDNDNAEMFWHCGNFSPVLIKKGSKAKLSRHNFKESHCAGIGEFELKEGNITFARMDGDNGRYSIFTGEGKTTTGPMSRGTYVWVEVNDWLKWEQRLMNGPYVHHCAGVYGNYSEVIYEACKYIKGLEPDPIEPDENEILKRLR